MQGEILLVSESVGKSEGNLSNWVLIIEGEILEH